MAADAPFITYAAQLPSRLVLNVGLNGKTQKIGFTLIPMGVPVFMQIPANVSYPLQTFVDMLREAMIYTPQ